MRTLIKKLSKGWNQRNCDLFCNFAIVLESVIIKRLLTIMKVVIVIQINEQLVINSSRLPAINELATHSLLHSY